MARSKARLRRLGAAASIVVFSALILSSGSAVLPAAEFEGDLALPHSSGETADLGGWTLTKQDLFAVNDFINSSESQDIVRSQPELARLNELDLSSPETFDRTLREKSLAPVLAKLVSARSEQLLTMANEGKFSQEEMFEREAAKLKVFSAWPATRKAADAVIRVAKGWFEAQDMARVFDVKQSAAVELRNLRNAHHLLKASRPRIPEEKIHAFLQAVANGDLDGVKSLIKDVGADVRSADEAQWTALMIAASRGHAQIVELLLNHGAKVDTANRYGETALMVAAAYRQGPAIKALLDAKADVNAKDTSGATALMRTASKGDTSVDVSFVALFLEHGVKINEEDHFGRTALMFAASAGHRAMAAALIDHGAFADAKDKKGYSVRDFAGNVNGGALATYLTVTENLIDDIHNHHPLWEVKRDLERGANVNARIGAHNGMPVLSRAIETGNLEAAKLLIERGADIQLKSEFQETALRFAVFQDPEMIGLLLDRGAKIDEKVDDQSNDTPLVLAARYGQGPQAAVLLERKAGRRWAAFDMALKYGHLRLAAFIGWRSLFSPIGLLR